MPSFYTIFVTVGTTKFNQLIKLITSNEIIAILQSFDCRQLILQIGKGNEIDVEALNQRYKPQLEIKQYRFKVNGIQEDIQAADLIIGHGGAGTCMDILHAKKLGLIVINELLMNNHQNELAEHLSNENYLKCCTIKELPQALNDLHNNYMFKLYGETIKENMCKFVKYMDELLVANQ